MSILQEDNSYNTIKRLFKENKAIKLNDFVKYGKEYYIEKNYISEILTINEHYLKNKYYLIIKDKLNDNLENAYNIYKKIIIMKIFVVSYFSMKELISKDKKQNIKQ